MLIRDDDDILVRDLSSTLGTIVNGQPLGRDFPVDSAPLRQGENSVVAGGAGSPFAFVVTVG
jgi:pSer/pThr/pTyr-binding forkhead associated (FHA) protein